MKKTVHRNRWIQKARLINTYQDSAKYENTENWYFDIKVNMYKNAKFKCHSGNIHNYRKLM